MSVVLSESDLRVVRAAQRALLSVPDGEHDAPLSVRRDFRALEARTGWVDRIAAVLRLLFETDHVYYTEPIDDWINEPLAERTVARAEDRSLFAYHPLVGDAFTEDLRKFFRGFAGGFTQFQDAETTMIRRLVRSAGAGAFHDAPLYDARHQSQSRLHRRVFQSRGIERKLALSAPLPVGEAMLVIGFSKDTAPRFEGRRHRILELLFPAFEAGIRIRRCLEAPSLGLGATVRSAPIPVVFIDTDGRERFRNEAFDQLLRDLGARAFSSGTNGRDRVSPDRLRTAVQDLALHVRDDDPTGPSAVSRAGTSSPSSSEIRWTPSYDASGTATGSFGSFRLRASRGTTYEGTPGTVIFVETPRTSSEVGMDRPHAGTRILPRADLIEARSPLTRRQAEVALLIAEGLSDQDIADCLEISVHTARRHAGSILTKLGLSSRAGIAVALLRATG